MIRPAPSTALALLAPVLVLSCGGAAPPAGAPSKSVRHEEAPEPRTIEEAEEQIARARAQLGRTDDDDNAVAPAAEPAPLEAEGRRPAAPHANDGDACGGPCRALASMKRAVAALCRLAGDGDDRCDAARRTLDESAARVASCGCPPVR